MQNRQVHFSLIFVPLRRTHEISFDVDIANNYRQLPECSRRIWIWIELLNIVCCFTSACDEYPWKTYNIYTKSGVYRSKHYPICYPSLVEDGILFKLSCDGHIRVSQCSLAMINSADYWPCKKAWFSPKRCLILEKKKILYLKSSRKLSYIMKTERSLAVLRS